VRPEADAKACLARQGAARIVHRDVVGCCKQRGIAAHAPVKRRRGETAHQARPAGYREGQDLAEQGGIDAGILHALLANDAAGDPDLQSAEL